ncbi:hypothetical protein V4C56_20495 [Paraburkholderia azotifigens]|uniref:Uncharacterized protein n=1 Tax=Paraburkholderia azotifigens TaxID=2057004 RepID=A0ABU9R4M5_9BURK
MKAGSFGARFCFCGFAFEARALPFWFFAFGWYLRCRLGFFAVAGIRGFASVY